MRWSLLVLFSTTFTSHAQSNRTLTIQSNLDHYDLILSGSRGSIGGKPADLTAAKEILGLLTSPLGNECPNFPAKSDATIKENGQTKSIYMNLGIITDGKACLNVGGEGIQYFPVHRDFLIGTKNDSIKLQSSVKVFRQGNKVLEIKKINNEWTSANPQELLNYDFIDRFENSLKGFEVRLRVQEAIGKDKPKMIVQSGNDSYTFYKLTNLMWAVKKPNVKWLEASDDWSFWYDFDRGLWEDRFTPEIRVVEDVTQAKDARLAALDRIGDGWSRNLRKLYESVLTTRDEDNDLQEIALKRLKRKPSLDSAPAMVTFLENTNKDALKREAVFALKILNPKGPKYESSQSASEHVKTIDFWRKWVHSSRKTP